MSNDASDEQGDYEARQPHVPSGPYVSSDGSPDPLFDPARLQMAEFRRTIFALTPRIYVTQVLLALNVAVFGLMCFYQVDIMNPNTDDMIAWGANFGPKTIGGQWWRLFSAMFLHHGVLHLGVNMYVLYSYGRLMERLLGNLGFAVMYIASGLCGNVASLFWNPMAVSAGASGAIFGLFGAMFGSLVRHQGSIPPSLVVQLRNGGLLFVVVTVGFGLADPDIDQAAHLGGLVGGFVCGVLMGRKYVGEAAAKRMLGDVLVAAFGVVVFLGGIFAAKSQLGDLPAAYESYQRFPAAERATLDKVQAQIDAAAAGTKAIEQMAASFEQEILPEWRAFYQPLAGYKGLPKSLQEPIDAIYEYAKLRDETWALVASGLRTNDPATIQKSLEKEVEVEAAASRINKAN